MQSLMFTKRAVTGAQAALQRQMMLNKLNYSMAAFAPKVHFSTNDQVQVQDEEGSD